MPNGPAHQAILALLIACALATAPALSRAPGDSPWHLRPALTAETGAWS
jgi:hypothetical protein